MTLATTRTEADQLADVIARERERQAAVERRRQRDGGMYDPILKRWIATDGQAKP